MKVTRMIEQSYDIKLMLSPDKKTVRGEGDMTNLHAARNFILENKSTIMYELYEQWLDDTPSSSDKREIEERAQVRKFRDDAQRECMMIMELKRS